MQDENELLRSLIEKFSAESQPITTESIEKSLKSPKEAHPDSIYYGKIPARQEVDPELLSQHQLVSFKERTNK